MSFWFRLRRFASHPLVTFSAAGALMMFATFLLIVHALTIRDVKQIGLPAAVQLPQMEQRLDVLKAQLEAAELQSALEGGSQDEQIHVYTLPANSDMQRLLGLFDALRDSMEQKGDLLEMSAIDVGSGSHVDKLTTYPVHFSAKVTQSGLHTLLQFTRIAGLLTVSDVLSAKDLEELTSLTEQENPAGVTVLEQFLATDLLHYAQEPKPAEELVQRSFSSPAFTTAFRAILDKSALAEARAFFGGELGTQLLQQHLWPIRFLGISKISVIQDAGTATVDLTLKA